MKKVRLSVKFPELAAAHAFQGAVGEGTTYPTAVNRALAEIFKRKAVKGKRITTFVITAFKEGQEDGDV